MRRRYLYLVLIAGVASGIGLGFEHPQRAQSPPVKAGLASEYINAGFLHRGRRIPTCKGGVLQPAVQVKGDAAKGRPIYEKYCLLCHGPQGRGDGPQGQLMNPPAPNFRSPESKRKSDEELLKTIREGHPDTAMTAWEDFLYDEDIQDVLAYIRSLSNGADRGF